MMRRNGICRTLLVIALLCILLPQSHAIAQIPPQVPTNRNIELVGSIKLPAVAQSLAVRGSYAYVALQSSGLAIIDISNRSTPRLVRTIALADGVYDIIIVGDYAYTIGVEGGVPAFERATRLRVLNLRNPTNPRDIGRYTISANGQGIPKLFLRGGYIFASVIEIIGILGQGGATYPIDITNPQRIRILPACCPPAQDIALIGDYIYVVYHTRSHPFELQIYYFSDISNVTRVAQIDFPRPPSGIEVVHDRAYIDTYGLLYVFDVRQPETPHEIATINTVDSLITASRSQLYFTNTVVSSDGVTASGLIRIRDINSLSDPSDVGTVLLQDTYIDDLIDNNSDLLVLSSNIDDTSRLSLLRYTGHSSLNGRVTDRTGKSLAGVTISNSWEQTVTTDSDGLFSFTTVPTGTTVFTATLTNYTFLPDKQTLAIPHDGIELSFIGLPAAVQTPVVSNSAAQLTLREPQGMETRMDLPIGTISGTATLALTPTLVGEGGGLTTVGYGFEVSPLTLSKPISITIRYADADIRTVTNESDLRLRWWNGSEWQNAEQSCEQKAIPRHDLTSNTFSVSVCTTGRFSLVGPTRQVQLPSISKRRLSGS